MSLQGLDAVGWRRRRRRCHRRRRRRHHCRRRCHRWSRRRCHNYLNVESKNIKITPAGRQQTFSCL